MEESVEDQLQRMIQRYNSMVMAAERTQAMVSKLTSELVTLRAEKERLEAELHAAVNNAQLLGNDFNERSRLANEHIKALRERLKENGLDPEVN